MSSTALAAHKREAGSFGSQLASLGLDFVPGVGSAKSALQAILGKDLVTGEVVNRKVAAGILLGVLPAGKLLTKSGNIVKLGQNLLGKFRKNIPGGAVRPGDTGTYGELTARRRAFGESEALDMDHQPSLAAQVRAAEEAGGAPLTASEIRQLRNNTPAVASPRRIHQQTSPTYSSRNNPHRVAEDAADLGAAQGRDRAVFDNAMRNR